MSRDKLKEQYADILQGVPFEFGPGWDDIVGAMLADLRFVDPECKVLQMKEKFGLLRVYVSGNEDVHEITDRYEALSESVCEGCGSTESVTTEGGWLRTLCKECRDA